MTLITSGCGAKRSLSIKWPESPRAACPSDTDGSGAIAVGDLRYALGARPTPRTKTNSWSAFGSIGTPAFSCDPYEESVLRL